MNNKSLITYLVALIVAFGALAYSSTQTINTLPSSSATFMTDLQAFLRNELPQYATDYGFTPFVYSGGTAATSANLTHTIAGVTAFPGNYFVTQAATAHTYTASTRTYVYLRDDTARTVTIAAAVITYSTNLVYAEMAAGSAQPTTPAGCLPLMSVDTSGAAITAVTDLRTTAGVFVVSRSGVVYGGVTTFLSDSGQTIFTIDSTGGATFYAKAISAVSGTITQLNVVTLNGSPINSYMLTSGQINLGASTFGVLNGSSVVGGAAQTGVSGIGYDITGRAYYAHLTGSTLISGNSLYGGRFGNDGATSEVTPILSAPLRGMHLLFINTQNTASGGTLYVNFGTATVKGLKTGFASGTTTLRLSAVKPFQAYASLECWTDGTWYVTGVSGESYRNK